MPWTKHFKVVNPDGNFSPVGSGSRPQFGFKNYQNPLPDVYTGHPNRIERYNQYENMDLDPEINAALDTLAEFCTQENEENNTPFELQFNDDPTEMEAKIINEQLKNWCNLNKFPRRIMKMVRNTLKYGDQIFIRDPETFELFWVDMAKVTKIIVNESQGKAPEHYFVKDLSPNFQNMTLTTNTPSDTYLRSPTTGGPTGAYTMPTTPLSGGSRWQTQVNEAPVDATNVVHLSLTEGLDPNWPFGVSVLETIFKVYKQKELLEDAILIYRVQRAPERRVFYIDTGNMPSHLAMQFVERVKNEIHQRRIPTQTGGGQNIMDATYNPLCLDLNTQIPLLDGRTLTLSQLIAEFEQGKENWAYSCDPVTGKIVPGVINWAGVTRKNAEVIKLTFDNGETLICTPDHKIPIFGKGFVEAKDLTVDDSLIAFNTRDKSISGGKTNEYQQVWDHESKSWKWTHRIVGEFFRERSKHQEFTYLEENIGKVKQTIHHIDCNRFNNDPRNLTYMNKEDHVLWHASQKKQFWETMSDDYRLDITQKISATVKANWEKLTPEAKQTALYNIRAAQLKAVWMRQNDPDTQASYKKNAGVSRKKYIAEHPEFYQTLLKNLENRKLWSNQKLKLPFRAIQIVADIVKTQSKNKNEVMKLCSQHNELMQLVKDNNSNRDENVYQNKIDVTTFGYSKMDRLLTAYGYKNWKTFVKEINNFNHKIVSIEMVESRDVGTITIDGTERWHDYHTFAISSGIFVKNSINEDYFFPQTAEGRGSRVETLPGGENLGQIDDLKFFNNKLMRGLRIPSSYLPTGPEDGTQVMSDGKVTTALIQEHRFNQYCERLQGAVGHTLDKEFKMFLQWRGFEIDNGLFELKFTPPMNFAAYRSIDLDLARISSFSQVQSTPFISKRFALKKWLGLSDSEIKENETLWKEEQGESGEGAVAGSDLRNVGVTPGSISGDLDTIDGMPPPGEEPMDQQTGGQPGQMNTSLGPQTATPIDMGTAPPPGLG